jgi:hypothetical protein
MFDKEFYPTKSETLDKMGFDCRGLVCLEPSSGKGNIIDYLKLHGAKEVLCVEKVPELALISGSKGNLIGSDWFDIKPEQISHVQLIVMNPPFSNADDHINHAFEIAPEGCEIYALCNWNTITNDHGYGRRKLIGLIKNYGISSNLGQEFTQAERTTGVEVGLVKLFKPVVSSETNFEGFFIEDDEQELQADGMIRFNEVRAVVNTYIASVKAFDLIADKVSELNSITNFIGMSKIEFAFESKSDNHEIGSKQAYVKMLQKRGWNYIIDKFNLRKFTTSEMMKDINAFVERQEKYPFTMKNIYHMMDMIIQTRGQQFEKALILAVDQLTQHVHENRYGLEGWKTNDGHMLNRKVIVPNIFERGWNNANHVTVRFGSHYRERVNDLVKVICSIEAVDYNTIQDITCFDKHIQDEENPDERKRIETGTTYEWGFFKVKAFYKGTMHLEFIDKKVWERLNRAYAQAKGFVLPEKI